MARIRSVKPEFWQDEDLADVTRDARLLYIGLWNLADEHGRLRGDPRYVKGQLFPYDDDLFPADVEELLKSLEGALKVVRYRSDGGQYLFLPNLGKHQRLESDKVPSRLPEPPTVDESSQVSEHADSVAQIRADKSARDADESVPGAEDHALLYVAGCREHVAGSRESRTRKPRAATPPPDDPDFDRFWAAYPKRMEKVDAKRAWQVAIKKTTADVLVAAAAGYAEHQRGNESKFIKYPATWLNKECWTDELPPAEVPRANGHQPYLNPTDPNAYDEYQLHGKPGDDELS